MAALQHAEKGEKRPKLFLKPTWPFAVMAAVCMAAVSLIAAQEAGLKAVGVGSQVQDQRRERVEAYERWAPSEAFEGFLSDPVWLSDEWAAIVDAEEEQNTAVWTEIIEEGKARAEAYWAPTFLTNPEARYPDVTEPMETRLPLTTLSMRPPLLTILKDGTAACRSGDVEAWLADWDGESSASIVTDNPGYTAVWIENAPAIIRVAAHHYC